MARKLKFEDAGETIDSAAPLEAQPVDAVEDDIAAAEQTTADTEAGLVETEAQLENRITNLEATVFGLIEQNKRLAALVRQNAEMTQVLQRNLKRLAGEPVVTERVPKTKQQPLEEFDATPTHAHPVPRYQMEAPKHVSEHRTQPTGDPWADAVKRQVSLNRATSGQGGL